MKKGLITFLLIIVMIAVFAFAGYLIYNTIQETAPMFSKIFNPEVAG